MSLRFILGNSGSGKTEYIYKTLTNEAEKDIRTQFFLIVPEQFTLSAQRELVKRIKGQSVMNIEVLSFNRLSFRVFDELLTDTLNVLEDTGKSLVLRHIFDKNEDLLKGLKGLKRRPGMIAEIKALISELMQYNIGPSELDEISRLDVMPPYFREKAGDILLIYESFLKYIEGRYITAEEILSLLKDVIGESLLIKDSVFFFDGFTGFTPVQNDVFLEILKNTKDIYLTGTIGSDEDIFSIPKEEELFFMTKKMIKKVSELSIEAKVEILPPIILKNETPCRFREGGEILFLEENLFRKGEEMVYKKEDDLENEIEIYRLKDNRDELYFIADKILSLISEKDYSFSDIGILSPDMSEYKNDIERIFREFDIPVFIDERSHLTYQPFIEFIRSSLLICIENFSYESVFHFIRSGFCEIEREEADLLDRYVKAAGIRGVNKYIHPFSVQIYDYTAKELVLINEIRGKFIERFLPFYEDIKKNEKKTVLYFSRALYEHFLRYDIEKKLLRYAALYREEDPYKAILYEKVYKVITELLDKMVKITGDEEIDEEEYLNLLDAGISEAKVGVLPKDLDMVTFGDLERTRLLNTKCLFLIGASDQKIPKSEAKGGIFSENERRLLYENDYVLSPTSRERAFTQRFYLYLSLSKPSEKLIITYPLKLRDKTSTGKSYLINTITKMLPHISIASPVRYVYDKTKKNLESAFPFILNKYAFGDELSPYEEKFLYYLDKDHESLVNAAFIRNEKKYVKNAFSNDVSIKGSVSRLENYARCAYSYLLRYGLYLEKRPEFLLSAADFGNLYHEILEEYGKALKLDNKSWRDIKENEIEKYLNSAIEKGFLKIKEASYLEDSRNKFIFNRVKRTLHVTIDTLTKQIKGGSFEPGSFEVSFNTSYDLSDGRMELSGKIDRIDICNLNGKTYIKIIDYKSGNTNFDISKCFYGLSMQLVTYLEAAVNENKGDDNKVSPGAVFYYYINDDVVSVESDDDLIIDKKILREKRVNGIINNELDVLSALDADAVLNKKTSDLAPFSVTKSGVKSSASLYNEKEIDLLRSHVNKKIVEFGNLIKEGSFDISPFKMGDETGCKFCDYKSICKFDTEINGFSYRNLKKISKDEFFREQDSNEA